MATLDGAKRRLAAAASALRGDYRQPSMPDAGSRVPERLPIHDLHPDLPAGLSEASMRAWLDSISIDGSAIGAMSGYLDEAFWRFVITWDLVRGANGRALELGANPYFITLLLKYHSSLDLSLANYFSENSPEGSGFVQQVSHRTPDGQDHSEPMTYDSFNMEKSAFPYVADSFDVVLFCEIIEHLLMDPLHPIREIHRVLKPGGTLVLTTPNVARLDSVFRLVEGDSMYDPYSGFGPYGRHNREFSRSELHRLLSFAGFEVQQSFTADAHEERHEQRRWYPTVAPALSARPDDLGQYIFIKATAAGQPRDGLPNWLYRSYDAGRLADD